VLSGSAVISTSCSPPLAGSSTVKRRMTHRLPSTAREKATPAREWACYLKSPYETAELLVTAAEELPEQGSREERVEGDRHKDPSHLRAPTGLRHDRGHTSHLHHGEFLARG
jgi:hypothetical protein